MKDYYAILGVLPSIEQSALKAVYAALMKKYHPDVTTLSKDEADRRTREINEAYSVLGDTKKRSEYDEQRNQYSRRSGDYSQESGSRSDQSNLDAQLLEDWRVVVSYFPEAEKFRLHLRKISVPLSETYQILIVSEKLSRRAKEISELLEKEFLKTYFGTNDNLHKFVLELIQDGHKQALLEINDYIRVIGTPSDEDLPAILTSIRERFGLHKKGARPSTASGGVNNKSSMEKESRERIGVAIVIILFVALVALFTR